MKKNKYLTCLISFIIAVLLISISGTAMFENSVNEEKTLVFEKNKKIDYKIESTKAKITTTISQSDKIQSLDVPAFDGITPAVSNSGSTMGGASYSLDQENVYYYFSLDYGETWDGGIGWVFDDPPELPSIDGCGDGRYIASFVPSPYVDEGSWTFKIMFDAYDAENTLDYSIWDWYDVGEGYINFIDVEVAGYTSLEPNENTWTFGAHAMIGDNLEYNNIQTPLFSYQFNEEGWAWIYTMGNFTGSESCGIDIDQGSNIGYAVYNYNNFEGIPGNMDLYVFIMDFNTWEMIDFDGQLYAIHNDTSETFINTSGNDNIVDISSLNDNVIIVSERDGAIIAYYSNDGLGNITEVQIDSNGEQPRIVHAGDNYAFCSYIKNGVLFTSITEDGGATWTDPNENSEEGSVNSGDICAFGVLYESEEITYFSEIESSIPIIEIDSISGGIGIKAVIKNTGTGDATDILYTIRATGGILGLINSEKSGTLSIPTMGEETISLPMIIGFGSIIVSVNAGLASSEVEGTQILLFTKI